MHPHIIWIVLFDNIEALEQFKKDYASYDREMREREVARKQG